MESYYIYPFVSFFFMSHHILKVHSHCSIDHNFIQLFLWLNNIVCSTLVTLEDTKAIPFDIVVLLLQTRRYRIKQCFCCSSTFQVILSKAKLWFSLAVFHNFAGQSQTAQPGLFTEFISWQFLKNGATQPGGNQMCSRAINGPLPWLASS